MRAYALQGGFGLDRLALVEQDTPRLKPNHVLLRVRAVSLNARDLNIVLGNYNPRQKLPLVPCSDAVAEVVEVGEGVRRVKVGERVATLFAQAWMGGEPTRDILQTALGAGPHDGTLRELMLMHEDAVVPVPAHLTDEEASTLTCAGITAWSALVTYGHVKTGDTVLTLGTGGVSIFALQFARMHGARVAITSRSDAKLERAKDLGAELGVSSVKSPAWSKEIRAWAPAGVDHVVEVGGAGTMNESIRSVRPAGTISLIGVLAGGDAPVNLTPVLMQNIRIQGVFVGSRQAFEAMNRAIAATQMRPVIDRVFAFEEARAAFEHLQRGEHFGKIVIRAQND